MVGNAILKNAAEKKVKEMSWVMFDVLNCSEEGIPSSDSSVKEYGPGKETSLLHNQDSTLRSEDPNYLLFQDEDELSCLWRNIQYHCDD